MAAQEAVKVAVRLRPVNQKERDENRKPIIAIRDGTAVVIEAPNGEAKTFTYDHAFGPDSEQVLAPSMEHMAQSTLQNLASRCVCRRSTSTIKPPAR